MGTARISSKTAYHKHTGQSSSEGYHKVTVQAKKEAKATKPQAVRLRRMLEEAGRAPLLFPLVVPEGPELLLVLLGDPDPERELLELPGLLVLAGGAGGKDGSVT